MLIRELVVFEAACVLIPPCYKGEISVSGIADLSVALILSSSSQNLISLLRSQIFLLLFPNQPLAASLFSLVKVSVCVRVCFLA